MQWFSWILRISFLIPFVYWGLSLFDGSLGADPAKELNHQTGFIALIYLVTNLWIGVFLWIHRLRKIPLGKIMRVLQKNRRFLGVLNFVILVLHLFLYLTMEAFSRTAIDQIFTKTYLQLGALAFLGMMILAFTSNDFSLKKLGGLKWKKVHQLVFLIYTLVLGHIFLIEKADLILFAAINIPLILFLLYRFMSSQKK